MSCKIDGHLVTFFKTYYPISSSTTVIQIVRANRMESYNLLHVYM